MGVDGLGAARSAIVVLLRGCFPASCQPLALRDDFPRFPMTPNLSLTTTFLYYLGAGLQSANLRCLAETGPALCLLPQCLSTLSGLWAILGELSILTLGG